MPDLSPDAVIFAALVEARPRLAEAPPDGMVELILQLAASIRHGSALLREATTELAEGWDIARLPGLLAQAEIASLEQANCARRLLEALPRTAERRSA